MHLFYTFFPRRTLILSLAVLCFGCQGDPPEFNLLWSQTTSRVETQKIRSIGVDGREVVHQRPHLVDAFGRYVHLRGINASGSHKAPPTEEFPSLYPLPSDPELRAECEGQVPLPESCIPERDVSYIGRPFPIEDADRWFGELAGLGFNSVRLITNWESIQPYKPGSCADRDGYTEECFDLEYLAYYDQLIGKAADHGLYVLVDMHQDIFSRFLMSYYNETPSFGQPDNLQYPDAGTLEHLILSMFPPYTDWVRGHGAPRWVVQTCLPEKDLDSPYWGVFRGLGGLRLADGNFNVETVGAIQRLFERLNPGGGIPEWISHILLNLPAERFEPYETSDMLPLTPWLLAGSLSLDVDRCFAALFAGDKVFPELVVDTDGVTKRRSDVSNPDDLPNIKDYLQDHYIATWIQLTKRTKQHENVIGYDLMNEPVGVFLMLAVAATFAQTNPGEATEGEEPGEGEPAPVDGTEQGPIEDLLNSLMGEGLGGDLYAIIDGLNLLPTDAKTETLQAWGIDGIDMSAALDLNLNFDANHLQPFFERVGQAIQEEDPNAIIWFEPGTSLRTVTGHQQFWDTPMTRLSGIKQLVYAPHWYPDIYPRPGINSEPREFKADEWLYRDFTEPLREHIAESEGWLGNVPVVFGEFGTYFNFGGIEASKASGYEISAHVLNSYYEAFEELGVGNMLWCFSAENDAAYGEYWNHEDFSIIDPDGQPRAWPAYVRTYARATSGKVIQQRFYSQYHFWDPAQGVPPPERTFELAMESRETAAPTEVFVPHRQYPEGFYVWVSDGRAFWDDAHQTLYWYPSKQEAGGEHHLRIEPRMSDREALGWSYFVGDGQLLVGANDTVWTSAGGVR